MMAETGSNRPVFGVVNGGAGTTRLASPSPAPPSSQTQFLAKRIRTYKPETITPVAWRNPQNPDFWCVGLYYERWDAHTNTYLQQPPVEVSLTFLEMFDTFAEASVKASQLASGKVYSQLYEMGLDAALIEKSIDKLPFTPPAYGTKKPKLDLVPLNPH